MLLSADFRGFVGNLYFAYQIQVIAVLEYIERVKYLCKNNILSVVL